MRGHPPGWRLGSKDPRWPTCLDDLAAREAGDTVSRLYVDGELPALPGVAVVGSRQATLHGIEVATRIGADLARRGVTVISGLALGVDAAAHRGCLAAGGRTVAVLGCGLAVTYPRAHLALRAEISARGALLSEYTSWDDPLPWRFPRRNRIIVALSRAVIVVEAGSTSGALNTAAWAADLGREVLAVPGSILGAQCQGSNRLLRDGARPYLDVSDLSDTVPECAPALLGTGSGDPPWAVAPRERGRRRPRREPQTPSGRLLALLGSEPAHRQALARGLGLPASELAVLLGELELRGEVRGLPGGLVMRASR